MTWTFSNVGYQIYERNPLVSTTIELRFFPIFRIVKNEQDWANFQDKVRELFPLYEQNNVRGVEFNPNGDFKIQDEVEHHFSDEAEKNTLVLGQSVLRITCKAHHSREQLIARFRAALEALRSVFGHVEAQRLGIRYVNIIDKARISQDLNESLAWEDLISQEFLQRPHEIADLSSTNFMMELRSNLHGKPGSLGLRYGLVQNQTEVPDHFRFDIDRYIERREGQPLDIDRINFDELVQDIFSLFHTVVVGKLSTWMR